MANDRKVAWFGSPERLGILQRLGIAGYVLSLLLVILAYNAPGDASIRYWLFAAGHVLILTGFAVAAVADIFARRKFSLDRLVGAGCMTIAYAIIGPVVMSAAKIR